MYLSTEARPGPSQTIKIKLSARIVNVFKLTLLTTLVKSTIVDVWRVFITPLTCSNAGYKLNVSQSKSKENNFDAIR